MPVYSAPVRKGLSTFFRTPAAPRPDITNLLKQHPNGLQSVTDFKEIRGDEKESIGIIGFAFQHGGLDYEIRYMTYDGGKDIAEFKVNIPAESAFLRPLTPVSIAEKIYMLSVVHHLADTTWIKEHLNRLEEACFDPTSGEFKIIQPKPIGGNLSPITLFAHIGLNFPPDSNYQERPDASLKAFEYWDPHKRYVMDISAYPTINFYVSQPKISQMQNQQMLRKVAEDMVAKVRMLAQKDMDVAICIGTKSFAENLGHALQRLPSTEPSHKGLIY